MKKKVITCGCMILTEAIVCLSSCGNNEISSSQFISVQSDNIHYVYFIDGGTELLKMVTVPDDTYDTIKPYFPVLPLTANKEGYKKEWEVIPKVYDEKQLTFQITTVFTKI